MLQRGVSRAARADEVDRAGRARREARARVGTLSGGQRRRLDLALGIAGDPELVFLDEPTTGFDPSARRRSWELVQSLAALGKTILLTTHYMDEAQNLADRVAVIAAGKIVAEGTPETLGGRDRRRAVRFRLPDGSRSVRAAAAGRDRSNVRTARSASDDGADADARAAPHLGGRAGHRAGGPDRHSALPRGRLPGADRRRHTMRRRSDLALARLWFAARVRLILRSPRGPFFTFVFPLILLVVFNGLNNSTVTVAGGTVDFAQFFTPAIGVFAVATGKLHGRDLRPRDAPRAGDSQARSWDAAADARLPRLLAGRDAPQQHRVGGAHVPGRGAGVRRAHLPAAAAGGAHHARARRGLAQRDRPRRRIIRQEDRNRAHRSQPDALSAAVRLGHLLPAGGRPELGTDGRARLPAQPSRPRHSKPASARIRRAAALRLGTWQ